MALIKALLAMRSRARVSASFYKAFERMRRALRINPGAVFFVYIKRRRRPRRDSGPTITLSGQKTVSDRRWLQIDRSLPRFWKKGVQHNERAYRLFHRLGDAGNYHARIRMANQYHIFLLAK